MKTKICSKCKKDKLTKDFSKDKSNKNGLKNNANASILKICNRYGQKIILVRDQNTKNTLVKPMESPSCL